MTCSGIMGFLLNIKLDTTDREMVALRHTPEIVSRLRVVRMVSEGWFAVVMWGVG